MEVHFLNHDAEAPPSKQKIGAESFYFMSLSKLWHNDKVGKSVNHVPDTLLVLSSLPNLATVLQTIAQRGQVTHPRSYSPLCFHGTNFSGSQMVGLSFWLSSKMEKF